LEKRVGLMEVGRRRMVPGEVAVVLVDGEGEPARYGEMEWESSWKSGPRERERADWPLRVPFAEASSEGVGVPMGAGRKEK
jgi:hypothetical protein